MITQDDPDYVTALMRGLDVLRTISTQAGEMTISEVASKTGLTRGTARRLLLTLNTAGYLSYDGKRFGLTARVMDLGFGYFASKPVWELAQPVMKKLVDKVDESCSLAVLDGFDVVYLARIPPKHIMTIPVPVGTRMPAHVNSMGRVLLANLPQRELAAYLDAVELKKFTSATVTDKAEFARILAQVKEQGYAMPVHELHEGRAAIAVPIKGPDGTVHAAMNLSAMLSRVELERYTDYLLPLLRDAAAEIGNALRV